MRRGRDGELREIARTRRRLRHLHSWTGTLRRSASSSVGEHLRSAILQSVAEMEPRIKKGRHESREIDMDSWGTLDGEDASTAIRLPSRGGITAPVRMEAIGPDRFRNYERCDHGSGRIDLNQVSIRIETVRLLNWIIRLSILTSKYSHHVFLHNGWSIMTKMSQS